MADSQEDYGDVDDGLADRLREAARERESARTGPDDAARGRRAWQRVRARQAARRLWAEIERLMQRGGT